MWTCHTGRKFRFLMQYLKHAEFKSAICRILRKWHTGSEPITAVTYQNTDIYLETFLECIQMQFFSIVNFFLTLCKLTSISYLLFSISSNHSILYCTFTQLLNSLTLYFFTFVLVVSLARNAHLQSSLNV
jgi:hypothetical protein